MGVRASRGGNGGKGGRTGEGNLLGRGDVVVVVRFVGHVAIEVVVVVGRERGRKEAARGRRGEREKGEVNEEKVALFLDLPYFSAQQ